MTNRAADPARPDQNPFFAPWSAPFEAPPLDSIKTDHFRPAFDRALAEQRAEIDAIVAQSEAPNFENTIAAMERSGRLLRRVSGVFGNLAAANTSPELQVVERELSPILAAHRTAILTNPGLFQRVDGLMSDASSRVLNDEQARVLDLTHKRFIQAGARLAPTERARVAQIDERLAALGTQFAQNVLECESTYLLVLENAEDLAGLPESAKAASAALAAERGHAGKYAVSISRSSVEPFLAYANKRDLRERLFAAWVGRGEGVEGPDNRPLIAETVALRAERAHLLGYQTYAQFKLDETMAETPEAVRSLLETVWAAGRSRALRERDRLQALMREEGENEALAPHDWRYYSEKARRADYAFDETELRNYFPLDAIIAAAFDTAHRLFGLKFVERFDLPVYHPDVRAFEVFDEKGEHLALFYADYFARASKRSGAWMSRFRGQNNLDQQTRPIIVNVMNFVKGGDGRPALLGFDEARTLFHEFGHALHGMLSNVVYPSIAGTSVPTDFVELPSQLFEHWIMQPETLRRFARHWQTGEPMPEELLQKAKRAATFNQGFATVEYCASALVDLDLHARSDAVGVDPMAAQAATLDRIGMPAEIVMRHGAPHFTHVFACDHYASGYYSYLWSEVLDADAFHAFEETGDVFNPEVAARLREFILSAGNRRDPKAAYLAFRGRLPDVGPLLEKRGLTEAPAPA